MKKINIPYHFTLVKKTPRSAQKKSEETVKKRNQFFYKSIIKL